MARSIFQPLDHKAFAIPSEPGKVGAMSAEADPIYYDSHMHTPLCGHAYGEPEEYAMQAMGMGLKGIIFTCHSPMPEGFWPGVRMADAEFDEYVAMVQRAAEAFEGRIDVRLGIESDFFPGYEDWLEELHNRADFHHVLGSVHYFGPEYQEAFWQGDRFKFRQQYFEHLAESAETGLFDTLAHPDLVKNLAPHEWDFEEMRETIASALDRIATTGVAMEINTSGVNKSLPQMNPGPEMLVMMCERSIPVVIGSDSHVPDRVGIDFDEALDSLEQAGYSNVSYFLNRERRDVPIADVRRTMAL